MSMAYYSLDFSRCEPPRFRINTDVTPPKDNYRFLRAILTLVLRPERLPPRDLLREDQPVNPRRWFLPITHKKARPRVMHRRNA